MKLVHPDGKIWEHFTDEPDLRLSDLVLEIRKVGDADHGSSKSVRIVAVQHQKDPERGNKTFMTILIDASEERVVN